MRYTSHLDLFRTWERTIRRAGLPLAYSAGYRPHPRLNLAAALPLGVTSECEVLDMWLNNELTSDEIQLRLKQALPPGIELISVEAVYRGRPALQQELEASEYHVTLLEDIPDLEMRIAEIVAARTLMRRWRDREYDLRPLILELTRLPDDMHGFPRIRMLLSAKEGATGRPEEVIRALGGKPERARYHRSRLIFALRQQA